MKRLNKNKIVIALMIAMLMNQIAYAGQFYYDNGIMRFIDDKGNYVTGWRWIDTNGDNICECYRFGYDGKLAENATINGKKTNEKGMWVVDGVVQQIYKSTGKPLNETNVDFAAKDTNKYLDFGTASTTKKRINTTKKDMKALIEADANMDDENYRKSLAGPKGTFEPSKEGYLLSKGVGDLKKKKNKRPVATISEWKLINTVPEEDDPVYATSTRSIIAGKDMRKFVSGSNKYTEKVDGAKIYGGEVWDDCLCLQGNGAYVTFKTVDSKSSFQANYFTFEVAHQTHGDSTADTDCCIELYLNGKSITTYDEFCDAAPEKVEEWLDDGETTVQLKAIITGDAPGRKIYIRNARFRQIRYKEDDE